MHTFVILKKDIGFVKTPQCDVVLWKHNNLTEQGFQIVKTVELKQNWM